MALEHSTHRGIVESHGELVGAGLDREGRYYVVDLDEFPGRFSVGCPVGARYPASGGTGIDAGHVGSVGPVEAEGHGDRLASRLAVIPHSDGYLSTRSHGVGGMTVGID